MAEPKPPILIVEDSPEDFEATCRAFARAGVNTTIYRAQDGDELIDYLYRRGRFRERIGPEGRGSEGEGSGRGDSARGDFGRDSGRAGGSAPRPGLILLDLNLPGTDGREALATIKNDPALRSIPVVVLTTSSDDRDIEICYRYGANSYIQKPVDLDQYMRLIRLVAEYWLDTVVLPKGDASR